MGKGRKPDRVYDLDGNRLTGQPTKDLLARAIRHPVNGYRLYRRQDLDALLQSMS